MKVLLIRLSPCFPNKRHLNPLMIVIALAALVPAYAIFGDTLPAALVIATAVVAFTLIGLALPKKIILVKWAFYEAAVFTAFCPIWIYLSERSDDLGWLSFALMILTAFAAGLMMLRVKSGTEVKRNKR